ncbi:helix-turn-helix transcriptional regulator [Dactylosporangium sp. NPDC005572]|uniref:helix-turn-helix domain-containing protein n=1 Tax=Dactylosporangium sp. NPDC005572 TaxID=3156889 RepID=UPI0033A761FE
MTDSPNPADQPVEPVGAVLARWRKRRKLTGQALGSRVGMTQSKISRLETGAVAAEPGDVRLLAEELGMPPAEVERIVELAERSDDRLTDWTSAQPGLSARQREMGRIEESARAHRVFQPTVVPGLIQTSEYARAILSSFKDELDDARIADSPVAVAEAVNARMRRSQILFLPDRTFHFLITEQVLRNRVCDPAAMVAQIARLREVAAYPNVDLRIIADDAELPIAPYHGFYVADDRWVIVDLFNASVLSKGRRTVHTYRRVFDALEGVASTEIGDLLDDYQARYARMLLPDSIAG